MMSKSDLESHILHLLDVEEIRYLKHRYANLCDENYPSEALTDLFVEEGIWSGPVDYGHHEGHAELRAFFARLGSGGALFTVHMVGNEEIMIDGDTAHGRWTTIAPCTFSVEGAEEDFWGFLQYRDQFVRRNGRWKILRIDATPLAGGGHLSGWRGSVAKG